MKKWECTVCGYIHTGPEPPDECPVCGADKSQFVEVTEPEEESAAAETSDEAPEEAENETGETGGADYGADRKWECTVCGYIHIGPEPPDECPVCGADKSQFVEVTETAGEPSEPADEQASDGATDGAGEDGSRSESARKTEASPRVIAGVDVDKLVSRVTQTMTELHVHPVSVHIPNGVLPVSVLFLMLAGLFGSRSLDTAAFCNLVIVLLSMPLVLFSGYNDWQRRYGGRLTHVFKVKIACGAVVTLTVLILVVWWIAQPAVLFTPGAGRWVFILIALAMLAAAATAGYYGGKLVFFYMSDKKK